MTRFVARAAAVDLSMPERIHRANREARERLARLKAMPIVEHHWPMSPSLRQWHVGRIVREVMREHQPTRVLFPTMTPLTAAMPPVIRSVLGREWRTA